MQRLNDRPSKQSGFTLIEMLVVISVIGFMATIVVVMVSNARVRARNTQRLANYKKIAEAFEAYRNDNGTYPPSYNSNYSCIGPASSVCYYGVFSGNASVNDALVPNYIQSLPSDNINSGAELNYAFYLELPFNSTKRWFELYTFYEGSPSTCPNLFPGITPNTQVFDPGYYSCFYVEIY